MPMRSFARYSIILFAALLALNWAIPFRYGETYPRTPGPTFDNAVRNRYTLIIEENRVDFVLVGDSVLEQGVDTMALSELIDAPAYPIAVPGSKSAFWYLILKNVILEAQYRPSHVVIVFRDTMLTLPNFHVDGGYIIELDQFATAHEDFLVEHAYLNFMNPLERWGLGHFPLYGSRQHLTEAADRYSSNTLARLLLSCDDECVERGMATAHHVTNVRDDFRDEALEGDEAMLFTRRAMNFKASVETSFLPEIIRLAKENGIRLVFVHARTQQFPSEAAEPAALRKYKRDLAAYLLENGIPLLDFSHDPRLTAEYFEDIVHMNDAGKAIFTQMLAEALQELSAEETR